MLTRALDPPRIDEHTRNVGTGSNMTSLNETSFTFNSRTRQPIAWHRFAKEDRNIRRKVRGM